MDLLLMRFWHFPALSVSEKNLQMAKSRPTTGIRNKLLHCYMDSSDRTGSRWSSSSSDTTSPVACDVTVHSFISHFENLSGRELRKCTRPSASNSSETLGHSSY
jgi:hypothetical protein